MPTMLGLATRFTLTHDGPIIGTAADRDNAMPRRFPPPWSPRSSAHKIGRMTITWAVTIMGFVGLAFILIAVHLGKRWQR